MSETPQDIVIDGPRPRVSPEALSAIGAETFTDTFGHLYTAADLNAFLAEHHSPAYYRGFLANPDCGVWTAAADDGALIGYALAGPCGLPVENLPPRSGELGRFYLARAWRGAGVGGGMLAAVLDWLEARFQHVYLGVYAENEGAQRLYRRWGFEKVGAYEFMVGAHADPEFIFKRTGPKAPGPGRPSQ